MGDVHVAEGQEHNSTSVTHQGSGKLQSRLFQQSVFKQPGVAAEEDGSGTDICDVRQTEHRSVRNVSEHSTSYFLFQTSGSPGVPGRCVTNVLGRPVRVRIPANILDSVSTGENPEISVHSDSNSSVLAEKVMVPADYGLVSGQTNSLSYPRSKTC